MVLFLAAPDGGRYAEPACAKGTITEHTAQVPPSARLTTRLKEKIVTALSEQVRCVQAVAADLGVAGRPGSGSSARR
ncbi:hypothetical protein MM440_02505 [Arsenicicoccus piscis]|uniref:hypothetical protein n=1 Tax=Arsenicicoccus piscis TaxID=673954 RepID=UPI001F4C55D8|nr:hypothetical protein [Arsenicicoccus piscis]MCH8626681.1 hypothetical protein [Arsenicicoccus piscis]